MSLLDNLQESVLSQLLYVLMPLNLNNLPEIRLRYAEIINNYQLSPKEESLVVYTDGKNEYLIKRFILAKAVSGCSKRTLDRYASDLYRIFNSVGKDADTIEALDLQAFFAKEIARGLASITVDNYRRSLSSFYGWTQREGLISPNPMDKVDKIKTRKKKKEAFSEMDVERIRAACRTNRERAMVEMMLSTGCRVTELVGIRYEDIQGDKVAVVGKGEKVRLVYLNAKAKLAIERYLGERSDKNPYLFPRAKETLRQKENFGTLRKAGPEWYKNPDFVDLLQPSDKGTIESICRNIGKRAGVDKVHPHRFRRTCATIALRRGMPIEQVSKMLGHEQLSTTQIYLDLSEEDLAQSHHKYVV